MAYPLLKDMAIHQFDLARDLIGSEPVSIPSRSTPDGAGTRHAAAEVNAEFADGTRFVFSGSRCPGPGDVVERQLADQRS